jgi:hypothetical protein
LQSIADVNSAKVEQILILEKEKSNLEQANLDLEKRIENLEKLIINLQEEKDRNQLLIRKLNVENTGLNGIISELEKEYANSQAKYQSIQEISKAEKENDKKTLEILMKQTKV